MVSESTPSRPRRLGRTRPGAAVRGVRRSLQAGLGDARSCRPSRRRAPGTTGRTRWTREAGVADLTGKGPPVLLAGVGRSAYAVSACEEGRRRWLKKNADVQRVRHPGVVRIMMLAGAAPCGLLAGDGQGDVLQVPYVDGAGLERRDHGAFEGTAPRSGHGRWRPSRPSSAWWRTPARRSGEFRSDLDVEDPGDARAPKSVAWPRDSQMTEVLTKAPASTVLNG